MTRPASLLSMTRQCRTRKALRRSGAQIRVDPLESRRLPRACLGNAGLARIEGSSGRSNEPGIATEEINRVIASSVCFGWVIADGACGLSSSFRQPKMSSPPNLLLPKPTSRLRPSSARGRRAVLCSTTCPPSSRHRKPRRYQPRHPIADRWTGNARSCQGAVAQRR